ncbi:MAG TPA: nuclease [Acidobacteriaceae bacterium]|jgi:hypothetical protein
MPRSTLILAGLAAFAACAAAQQGTQQALGTVATRDALVTGGLEVHGERARLLTNASVTAYDRTAPIELERGGEVLVCSTSQFHLLRSGNDQSLLFALDRGAVEVHGKSQPQDVLQTPDLRFTLATAGDLDLRLRVTANGDTCVENRGAGAPQLSVGDAFSDATYHLFPGQHVLFEHGSLREVVDHESSSCGCPPPPAPVIEVAQTPAGAATTPVVAEAHNPFPAAVSQGLAVEAKPVPATQPDAPATQVSTTMSYGSTAADKPAETPAPVVTKAPEQTSLAPPPSPPGTHDIAHAIGRFFHRLFHGGK